MTDGGATKLDFGSAGSIVVTDPKLLAQSCQARKQDLVFGTRPEQLELRRGGGHASFVADDRHICREVGARTIVHLEHDGPILKVAEKNGYQAERGESRSVIVPQAAALSI